MNITDYLSELDRLKEPTAQNMQALAGWTLKTALPWLWDELSGIVITPPPKHPQAKSASAKKILKTMACSDAVRHGLMLTLADEENKTTEPDRYKKQLAMVKKYYQAQLTMMNVEAKHLCDRIQDKVKSPTDDAVVGALHHHLHEILMYARILLKEAAGDDCRRTFDTAFEVIGASSQMIYGAYYDRAPWVPIAGLRTAIELRLRQAFMIFGFVSQSDPNKTKPIEMSAIFEAIKPSKEEILFAVDIDDVQKIYQWSNRYLHAGFRDYPWVPGFLLRYVLPLFTGKPDINDGIRMSEDTWKAVRARITPRSRSTPSKKQMAPNDFVLLDCDCSLSDAAFVLKS